MPSKSEILIPRPPDAKLLSVLLDAHTRFGGTELHFDADGLRSRVSLGSQDWKASSDAVQKQKGSLITSAHLVCNAFYVIYERSPVEGLPFFAKLTFQMQDVKGDANKPLGILEVVGTLSKSLGAINKEAAVGGAAFDAEVKLQAMHHSVLERLELTATTQLEANQRRMLESEREYAGRRTELDRQNEERIKASDEREAERRAALGKERDELRKREAALDDRQNTHARRANYQGLGLKIDALLKDFSLTQRTKRLRWPIHTFSITLLLALALLLYWWSGETLELLKATAANGLTAGAVYAIARSATLAAAFIGTAFFYLRWMNQWAEAHSGAEFQMKKLALDVERANWVVEAALEWQHQTEQPMPSALMDGITRNLFDPLVSGKSQTEAQDPADQLASAIIGSAAAKVKLNMGGAEVEIDPGKLGKPK